MTGRLQVTRVIAWSGPSCWITGRPLTSLLTTSYLTNFAWSDSPGFIVSWVAAFLHARKQGVRVHGHSSNWLPVHGGVPRGTPAVFLFMVNDLLEDHLRIKFVDGTLTWERCHVSGNDSSLQSAAESAAEWSLRSGMQLNVDTTREMVVFFSRKFQLMICRCLLWEAESWIE